MNKKNQTIGRILDLIITEEWNSGERLHSERVLAEKLGVSRNTLREAMHALTAQGVIEMRRGSGNYLVSRDLAETAFAQLKTPDSAEGDIEACEAGFMLIPQVAELCAHNCPQALIDEMEKCAGILGRAFLDKDLSALEREYRAFLRLLAKGTGNKVLHGLVLNYCQNQASVFNGFERLTEVEHDRLFAGFIKIMRAIKMKNPELARTRAIRQGLLQCLMLHSRQSLEKSPILAAALHEHQEELP